MVLIEELSKSKKQEMSQISIEIEAISNAYWKRMALALSQYSQPS